MTALAPFGLKPIRSLQANSATQGGNVYFIKKGYASAIAFGDPVITLGSGNIGYVGQYVETGTHVLGVFGGIVTPYYDLTLQQPITKSFWAGSENPSGDVPCLIYDDPYLVFLAQVAGGPITQANRGGNIDIIGAGAPNIFGGSTAALDFASYNNTTATLPFRIVGISSFGMFGIDPTNVNTYGAPTANNLVEVVMNTSEFKTTTGI